jgi:spore coat polysaccharide biosynthesis protein SpsF
MRTVAIIQARMASSRLPGKVLIPLAGEPMILRVVNRARRARRPDLVAVATSVDPADDPLAALCQERGIPCFRGSHDDVLDRYHGAAAMFEADLVVRLTADCPLLDGAVIDQVVAGFVPGITDYASNTLDRTFPDGLDTEVFSKEALDRAWREAEWASEREHVTPYIWKHPEKFRLASVRGATDCSQQRWTVDEARDLTFMQAVCPRLPVDFSMQDVLDLLAENPSLRALNAGIPPNEGYDISLSRDERRERVDRS